jgi:hypothetical protein
LYVFSREACGLAGKKPPNWSFRGRKGGFVQAHGK